MNDDPLESVRAITNSARKLLSEKLGLLTPAQIRALEAITTSAQEIEKAMIILFDPSEQAKTLLSYETREHLAAVMGYTEMLLEGGDGAFNPTQIQRLHHIRASGKMLLVWLDDFLNSEQ
jgi:hypothetical protein